MSTHPLAKRDIVVIGASAGGVEALHQLVAALPADFPGTVLVVLHVPPTWPSLLPQILGRAGQLPVRHAVDGDLLLRGQVLVAPPDCHLLVVDGRVSVSHGPKENGHRPSVDVLFRSAANAHGTRVAAVVLSGALDDGAAGMVAVKLRGGLGIVQDPEQALHGSMPRAAAAAAPVDETLPVEAIAERLSKIVLEDAPPYPPQSNLMRSESAMADLDGAALADPDRPGEPAGLACPDCHGTLFEIHEGGLRRYRCRVGHAWSPESLLAKQTSAFETALWVALRTLEEKAALTLDLSGRAQSVGHKLSSRQFERQSEEARSAAEVLRSLIDNLATAHAYPDLQGSADALPAE